MTPTEKAENYDEVVANLNRCQTLNASLLTERREAVAAIKKAKELQGDLLEEQRRVFRRDDRINELEKENQKIIRLLSNYKVAFWIAVIWIAGMIAYIISTLSLVNEINS